MSWTDEPSVCAVYGTPSTFGKGAAANLRLAGAGCRTPSASHFLFPRTTHRKRATSRRGHVFCANPSTIRRCSTRSHGRSARARTTRLHLECSHEPQVAPQPQLSFTTACERKETQGDAAALAPLYAEDAVLVNDTGPMY